MQRADVKGIEDLLMMPCGILDCARDWCLRLDSPQQRSALVRTVIEGWILAEGVAKDDKDILGDILNEEVEASNSPSESLFQAQRFTRDVEDLLVDILVACGFEDQRS